VRVKNIASGRRFSILQATTQALQPMQRFRSNTIPHRAISALPRSLQVRRTKGAGFVALPFR
jgi:hypothetical protein